MSGRGWQTALINTVIDSFQQTSSPATVLIEGRKTMLIALTVYRSHYVEDFPNVLLLRGSARSVRSAPPRYWLAVISVGYSSIQDIVYDKSTTRYCRI